jgi:hypothetical protein
MKYTVDKQKDTYTILGELATINAQDFEVFIPTGSLILENRLNLEFLQESLEKLGKSVSFSTDDATGQELLTAMRGGTSVEYETVSTPSDSSRGSRSNPFFKLFQSLAFLRFPKVRLSKLKVGFLPILLIILFLGGAIFGVSKFVNSQKAYVKLVVKSESLARSISVLVDANLAKEIDPEAKSFKGKQVSKTFTEEITQDATGEKLEGDTASGEILIYNRTEDPIKLKKGTILIFNEGDEDLKFKLDEEVTIPAESYEDPEDPGSVMVPGEKSAKVVAMDIGSKYNIDKNKTLGFSDYKKTELTAKSSGDFEGGSSETIKVVSAEDISTALEKVKVALVASSNAGLADSVGAGYKYIDGSSDVSYVDPEIGAKSGDEVNTFTVKQSAIVTGLSYSEKTLEKLIKELLAEYVPESFELSGDNIDIKASSLGNTEETIASSTKADLQVTAKTMVIPAINVEDLKKNLAGKTINEASRILGEMRILTTYEFKLEPNLPFSQKVPEDLNRILVEVVEEN